MPTVGRTVGQVSELTILAKIKPDSVETLRQALQTLDPQTTFQALDTVHFARFVILGGWDDPEQNRYLLFTTNYDAYKGGSDAFITDLLGKVPDIFRAVWAYCEGWPDPAPPEAMRDFILQHAVTASMAYASYPEATVKQVKRGLQVDQALQNLLDALQ
jgi:hypothetical protein